MGIIASLKISSKSAFKLINMIIYKKGSVTKFKGVIIFTFFHLPFALYVVL